MKSVRKIPIEVILAAWVFIPFLVHLEIRLVAGLDFLRGVVNYICVCLVIMFWMARIVPRGCTWHSYRQGSVELGISEQPKNTLPLKENSKKYFLKSETLKNTLLKHNSLSES